MAEIPNVRFNNGVLQPVLGLGTWQPPGSKTETRQLIKDAIDIGYRHFDCAQVHGNEDLIGEAISDKISDGTVKRAELFITSKLWNTHHRPDLVEVALRGALKDLRLDYVDLYLIHWPTAFKEGTDLFPQNSEGRILFSNVDFVDTWTAMEDTYKKGLTRSIGLANFNSLQIGRILKECTVPPMVNQVECHPYLNQQKLRKFCMKQAIRVTGYSPLALLGKNNFEDANIFDNLRIKEVAEAYERTPAQILLRYQMQLNNATIVYAFNKEQLSEYLQIFDFCLYLEDMAYISKLERKGRLLLAEESIGHPSYPFAPNVQF